MKVERSAAETRAYLVEVMVDMLFEMDSHEIRVNDLARRSDISVPSIYYHFRSLDELVSMATVVLVERFMNVFLEPLDLMSRALREDDNEKFRAGLDLYFSMMWSDECNHWVHRIAPQIILFRRMCPDDRKMREAQSESLGSLSRILTSAQQRGWIDGDCDVTNFVIHHWSNVLSQAVFWHPSFGALTGVQWRDGVGHLELTTAATSLVALPVQ